MLDHKSQLPWLVKAVLAAEEVIIASHGKLKMVSAVETVEPCSRPLLL